MLQGGELDISCGGARTNMFTRIALALFGRIPGAACLHPGRDQCSCRAGFRFIWTSHTIPSFLTYLIIMIAELII
jgi:hypothetical protein